MFCTSFPSKGLHFKWHIALIVGANVFIDNSFLRKTPAYREFPSCSSGGFTPLTSCVAAEKHILSAACKPWFRDRNVLDKMCWNKNIAKIFNASTTYFDIWLPCFVLTASLLFVPFLVCERQNCWAFRKENLVTDT